MPEPKIEAEELMQQLLGVFRTVGYEGASLSRLSQATGLQRASLYHRFPGGKEEMARAVVDYVAAWVEENIVAPLRRAGAPEQRVKALCRTLESFYAGGERPCIVDALSLGAGHDLFQAGIGHTVRSWIRAMARVARDAGVATGAAARQAEEAMIRIQGALVLARGIGDRRVFKRMLSGLPALLLARAR